MGLKLGTSTKIMVVQTAQAAAELFNNNDTSFADRLLIDVNLVHNYNQEPMVSKVDMYRGDVSTQKDQ